jgi:ubiquinone/menaquinone biosynthesis C-methylase UbiE
MVFPAQLLVDMLQFSLAYLGSGTRSISGPILFDTWFGEALNSSHVDEKMEMSPVRDVAARFDRIADVYDDTREPISQQAMANVATILTRDGCKQILEVGVGTGRIASPLQRLDFEITGIDVSHGMLTRAKQKRLSNLLIAEANTLPFRERSFDAAMISDVLHLLDDPVVTLNSLNRVSKKEVIALMRRRDDTEASRDYRIMLREALRDALAESGYRQDSGGNWRRMFERETEFIAQHPPTELVVISDTSEIVSLGERLSRIEKRGWAWSGTIPENIVHQAIEKVRETVDVNKSVTQRRVEQMCIWRKPQSRSQLVT